MISATTKISEKSFTFNPFGICNITYQTPYNNKMVYLQV